MSSWPAKAGSLLWFALVATVLAAPDAHGAPIVWLCSEDAAGDRPAARALQRWLRGVNLQLRDRRRCNGAGRPELHIVRSGRRVQLVLRSGGRELRRDVPWIARADGALARLALAGRLSELSVIITALVAESKARGSTSVPAKRAASAKPAAKSAAPDRVAAKRAASAKPAAKSAAPDRVAAKRAASAKPAAKSAAPDRATAKSAAPDRAAAARSASSAQASARLQPASEPVSQSTDTTSRTRAKTIGRAEIDRDEPGAPSTKDRRVAEASQERLGRRDGERQGAELRGAEHRPAALARSVRSGGGWLDGLLDGLAVAFHAGGRYRSSAVWSAELGGALRWRSVFVRAGYQMPASWDLQGRPIEVTAVPILLGWQPRLLGRGAFGLGGMVAVAAERLAVRRLDLPDAATHTCWDLGAAVGAVGSLRLAAGFELALQVEASWMPAGRQVEVPQGPSAVLSRFAVQTALVLWWGPAGRSSDG